MILVRLAKIARSAVILSASLWCALATAAHAGIPLLDEVAETRSVGPKTEAVDLSAYRKVLYVSASGAAGNASGSREHPLDTVQAALDACTDAGESKRCAILVAAGTYSAANLRMKEFVDLFGGFGANWQRDILQNTTVLDGEQKGPVIHGASNARIDGFVITNGLNRGVGGGIVCDHVSPVISNNIIRGNGTIEPEDFRRDMIHQKAHDGGGIALVAGSSAEVRGNLIYGNTTGIGNGGGIFVWKDSNPKIVQNVICDNHTGRAASPGKEGSRSSNGGAIAVSLDCRPQIIANVIAMNTVADNSDAGGIYLEYDAHAQIRGNWIVGNLGMDDGGGLYVMKLSEPVLVRNVFAGNRNTSGGSGAIRLSKEGRLRATNNLIVANVTGIDAVHSWMVLRNNTFVDCVTTAIVSENATQYMKPSQVSGNIFWGEMKTPLHIKPGPADPILTNNLIPGGSSGQGNITADPGFTDDSVTATIASRKFDGTRYLTTLTLGGSKLEPSAVTGRVINVGEQWSVIHSNDSNQLMVWGNLSDKADSLRILGTYRPSAASPARHLGAYASPGDE
jgi:hypothetical protein